MSLHILTTSANGKKIFYDPDTSHAATHFADTPQLKALVKEILSKTNLDQERLLFDTTMDHIVGMSDLVKNDVSDVIVYAKRKNRDVYTSFNKTQTPQPCATVAIGVEKLADGNYVLLSAWIGSVSAPPFPGDAHATPDSKSFWLAHSLAWGSQEIQPGTEITNCPW